MIGNDHFDQLIASAPVNFDAATIDWAGLTDLLRMIGISASEVVAVTWCSFGLGDIESLIDEPALTMVHRNGVLSSAGRRKAGSDLIEYHSVAFRECRRIAEADSTDNHGFGKYCIEFLGPGGVLVGRLQWSWWTRLFWRSRARITATAEERDRILSVIRALAKL
ncbi:MAG TPA: hypothetical protein VMA95_10230 [Streptosporangiaceae bacterium]|nr:hypothetical protein [Streptosporangiaceae bacterium]